MKTDVCETVPQGYAILSEWWLANEPGAFELLLDPRSTMYIDADELEIICQRRGVPVKHAKVTSPELIGMGFKLDRAFPLWMLHEFYPTQP